MEQERRKMLLEITSGKLIGRGEDEKLPEFMKQKTKHELSIITKVPDVLVISPQMYRTFGNTVTRATDINIDIDDHFVFGGAAYNTVAVGGRSGSSIDEGKQ